MIIKKKGNKEKDAEVTQNYTQGGSGKIIKAGAQKLNALKKKAQEKKKLKELEEEIANGVKKEAEQAKEKEVQKKSELELKIEEYEKIDVSVVEFKERYERRRGERRRGFRRIDERALVSRAQEEARNIREVAAQEGYKNGLKEASNEIEILKTSLNEFVGARRLAYEEASEHILEIALEIAKKIIKKEVELSNEVLKSVMSEVFGELNGSEEKVTIKVNPEDVEFARASLPEVLKDSPVDARITVLGDDLIDKGSCTVIASNGVVDANFSTQLNIIQSAFGIYKGGE